METQSQLTLFETEIRSIISPISYMGSKKQLVPYIKYSLGSRLNDITEMVSPFIGGGSVELWFASRGVRVHGYDNFPPLVNFWHHMLTQPSAMVDGMLHYRQPDVYDPKLTHKYYDIECPLEQAIAYWVINKGSYAGATLSGTWLNKDYNHMPEEEYIETFRTWSAPFLSVNQQDCFFTLARHDTEFAYCDPPYVNLERYYGDGKSFRFPHEELSEVLKSRRGDWLLSYHDDPLIRELYPTGEFFHKPVSWQYGGKSKYIGCQELLIMRAR